MTRATIFLWVGGAQQGPYSRDQVMTMRKQGIVSSETLYWSEGMSDWAALERFLEPVPVAEPAGAVTAPSSVVKVYRGNQEQATSAFQNDAIQWQKRGYTPTTQTWSAGNWTGMQFFVALLLCLVCVGFLVFIYMVVVKPPGSLTVTYVFSGRADQCPSADDLAKLSEGPSEKPLSSLEMVAMGLSCFIIPPLAFLAGLYYAAKDQKQRALWLCGGSASVMLLYWVVKSS